jgi:chromate reductase, NAD(P)H dehydrogenase (quinone)
MKKLLIIPGSQRADSLNLRLAVYLAELLALNYQVQVLIPSSVELPLFNQDRERDSAILARVEEVYRQIESADGLMVLSPEYNGSLTPYLKNTVDWVSRLPRVCPEQGYINPFNGKPLLLGCATPGHSGGTLAMIAMRQLFVYLGALVLSEQISLPLAREAWDERGFLQDTHAERVDRALAHWTCLLAC